MILRLIGWLAVPHWGRAKKLAYRSYGIAACVLVSVSALEQARGINDRFSIEEYGSGFTAIAQVIGFFFVASFTVLFAVNAKRLREFDTELKRTVALAMKYSPKITSERYDRSETHSSLIVLTVLSALEASVVLWFGMTLYDHLFLIESTGKSPRFAFPWLFYGLDPHREFWIILALQFMHGLFCACMVALGFAFPPAMCTLLQGQIEILKESLPMARDSAGRLILSGFDSKRKIDGVRDAGGEDMEDQVDLRDCIVHHQMILRLLK
ncbi:uncharacterized protein [Bemisia tabaci]|uniref:uncharacterized protein n=1 Tax=Bemisia tabaci TaxID=7038 RepID=UPI003B28CFEF